MFRKSVMMSLVAGALALTACGGSGTPATTAAPETTAMETTMAESAKETMKESKEETMAEGADVAAPGEDAGLAFQNKIQQYTPFWIIHKTP